MKKNQEFDIGVNLDVLKKNILVMKLVVCLLTMSFFTAWGNTHAQVKLSLDMKNATLAEVFDQISRQTGYYFAYSDNLLEKMKRVTFNFTEQDLGVILRECLKKTGLGYRLEDNVILISSKYTLPQNTHSERKVWGFVKDKNGIPLPGVTVLIKGTHSGVATDINGKFEILVGDDPNIILQFSFIGMATQEKKIGAEVNMSITLEAVNADLGEVVITGYQTISKERSPGSFSIISPVDMSGRLQTNIVNRLEGLVAGLIPYKKDMQIRGISTINGEKKPLYVVDGIPYEGSLDALNPADVVNVTVLKDATAASIYGARSANGVIVITTRRGTPGKMRISYNGSVKFTPLPDRNYLNLMSSSEFVDFQADMFNAYHEPAESVDIKRADSPVYQALYKNETGELSGADLKILLDKYRNQDNYNQIVNEFLRKRSITHQHNLSMYGGSDFYQYMLSLNYLGDSPFERVQHKDQIGFNLKNSFQFTNWLKADIGIMGTEVKEDYNNGVAGMEMLNGGIASYYMLRDKQNKLLQYYKEKSQWELDRLISLGLLDQSYYPVNELDKAHYFDKNQYINLNVGLNIKMLEGLSVDLRYQTEKGNVYSKQYWTKDAWYVKNMINNATKIQNQIPTYYIPLGGQLREVTSRSNSFTMRAQINFDRTFADKHEVSVIAGGERRKVIWEGSGQYKVGYDDHNLTYKFINESDLRKPVYGTESPNGSFYFNAVRPPFTNVEDRYVSFYGNASYTFNQRISASASIRMDQSNLFGTDPKYQYRPLWSVGLSYIILENYGNWLDRFSGRITYGINGNISKQSGPYLIAKPWGYGPNYLINENYTYISTPPNSGLRWEKTKVTNLGMDFSLFKNRLTGTIEYYSKNTSDLLGTRGADPTIGWANIVMNYGDMRNRGVELTLHSKNIVLNDFRWTSDFIFAYNRNKITNIKSQQTSAASYFSDLQAREGYPINSLFSVRYAGLDEKGNPTAYNKKGEIVKSVTELTKDDLVYSGTNDPRYNAAFTNTFSYKGIELSFMFVYYGGHVLRDVEAGMYLTGPNTAYMTNLDRDFMNYWKKPEDSRDIRMHPAYHHNVSSGVEVLWQGADIHVKKGDYIKLRDLTLGYTLPQRWIQYCHLQNVRFDLQIQNVWRWAANDKRLDPEAWRGDEIYSLDRGSLTPTTYSLGLTVNF